MPDQDRHRKNPLGPTGKQTAANIVRLRRELGLTLQQLSDRLAERGRSIAPLGLRRIESQDRRIDADDLVALAVVLGVNPSALLLPPTVEGDAEVTGAGAVAATDAWRWADGRAPLPLDDAEDAESARLRFQLRARPPGWRSLLG